MKHEIIYRKTLPMSETKCKYPGFNPHTEILKRGTQCKKNSEPLTCDILFMQDVCIKVRDGAKLYCDIYRPTSDEKVPAIVCSGNFGKSKVDGPSNFQYYGLPEDEYFPGVKKWATSGLNAFESIDPGHFVPNGFAVVNLDIRGAYMNDGKSPYFGTQETDDDVDVIEWLANQEWCNGSVAMAGDSWLGIVQWFAASRQTSHLKCIAPWEGWCDMYRDEYMVGGIGNYPGFRFHNVCKDNGEMEDVIANCIAHPLYDWYWEDKAANIEKIEIPVYATASWTSPVHCQGTFRAWRRLNTEKKWLRVHNVQEWRDITDKDNEKDLMRFFDRYLKAADNNWEETPKIRLSILDLGGEHDVVNRHETEFPLKRQKLDTYYLDASNMSIVGSNPKESASVSYNGCDGQSKIIFKMTFDKDTEITGYIGVKIWVESFGYDNCDIFYRVSKLNKNGELTKHEPIPWIPNFQGSYYGPSTRQRVALRKLNLEKSTANEPFHTFDELQPLRPGEIVPVEVALYPTGMLFHSGETLQLELAGYRFFYLPMGAPQSIHMGIDNNGDTVIHTGGIYDSHIILPVIPNEKQ